MNYNFFRSLVLFICIATSMVVCAENVYITKNLNGIAGGQYCVEYTKITEGTANGQWYVNKIYVKGVAENATATTPIIFDIDGGSTVSASLNKFDTNNTQTINATQVGNPETIYGFNYVGPEINFKDVGKAGTVSVLNEDNTTATKEEDKVLNHPFSLNLIGAFTTINRAAFYLNALLRKVVLTDGSNGNNIALQTIGHSAFAKCTGLTAFRHFSVTDGDNLFPTAVKRIETSAFYNTSLTGTLTIHTGCEYIGTGAFGNVEKITTATFKNMGTTSQPALVFDKLACYGMRGLETVSFEQNVKTIGEKAFYNSSKIHHITFAQGLEEIGLMAFYHMSSTDDMILPSTLKSIGHEAFGNNTTTGNSGWVFYNDLTLPESLEFIGNYVFAGMRGIQEKLVIPNSVSRIGERAFLCAPIKHLEIGSGVTTFGRSSFFNCALLETVVFKSNNVLKGGGLVFALCNSLRYIQMNDVQSNDFNTYLSDKKVTRAYLQSDPFFGGLPPYTLVYLPQTFSDETAIGTEENDVNFIFRNGSEYYAPKFVAYDEHKSYQEFVYRKSGSSSNTTLYTGVLSSIQSGPAEKVAAYNAITENKAVKYRGCDIDVPVTFTAKEASYVRTFANQSQYYTVSLPYAPQWDANTMNQVKPFKMAYNLNEGTQQVGHYFYSIDDDYFRKPGRTGYNKLTAEETAYSMTPYKGYAIHFYNNADASSLFKASNVKVYAATDAPAATYTENETGDWELVGTVKNVYNEEATTNQTRYTLDGKTKTWHRVNPGNPLYFIPSLRATVKSRSNGGSAKPFVAFFMDENTTTGIEALEESLKAGNEQIYNLNGQYMGNSIDSLPAGIYVVKGRKFYKN
ncbi:MAG: leucine-rich repeat domain-containing protein [Prevotella sp.]|nr:leucine-rich repeat domain-containing protein [Prevotella sp.]MDY3853203.1 leucine-rich repeat domain-containing protein [Prevotella sp.]